MTKAEKIFEEMVKEAALPKLLASFGLGMLPIPRQTVMSTGGTKMKSFIKTPKKYGNNL